jgi:hypothetical protein
MAQRKMVDLLIEETSGVDHPAHLHEGWLVMKAASPSEVWRVLDTVGPDNPGEGMSDMEKQDLLARLAEVEAENAALRKAAGSDGSDEAIDEDVLKSLPEPVRAAFEQMQKDAEAALAKARDTEEALVKEREQRADAEMVDVVKAWEHLTLDPAEVGPALRKVRDIDADLYEAIAKALTGANAQNESAEIMKQVGSGNGVLTLSTGGDAATEIDAVAKSIAKDEGISYAAAVAKAAKANPDLYSRYQTERKG